jgi:hypothetical protein
MKHVHILQALILAAFAGVLRAAPPPEIAAALETIRAIGPEGRGNAAASAAWRTIAASDATGLTAVLGAMDGANDYALNWLCPAVDAIAGREIDAGRSLPLADLGRFLLEGGHHPRARRLAFEWVGRVDAATADQLLGGMLNDSSLEIRRDAVQGLMDQADQTLVRSNAAGAGLLWQQALSHARDVRQIESIARKLLELGQPVDLRKQFGFLDGWKIIGPFDNTANRGFDTAYPPESNLDLAAELDGKTGKVRWQDHTNTHPYGMVDMNQPFGKLKGALAYATTTFYSERAQPVELRLGGKNSWKVWLNGRLLFGHDEYHANAEIDQYPMPAGLQRGPNTILVKVCQNEEVEAWTEEWEFQLRVTDAIGTPIPSAPPPAGGPRGASNTNPPDKP